MKGATTRMAGLFGLLATPLVPAHYVSLLWPLARGPGADHPAIVEAIRPEAPGVCTLVLKVGRRFPVHVPGQHVRVHVPVDGRIATRTYSIASAPRRDHRIEITVKAQGRVSDALVHLARPGDRLSLGAPEGDFVLSPAGPRLFLTAGSGITPIASMLRSLAATGPLPDITHVHHARTAEDVIFGDELRALAAAHPRYRLAIVLTAIDRRRWSADRLDDLVPDWRAREAWACGPAGLLDAVTASFAREGLAARLHVERFAAPRAALPDGSTGGRVRFSRSRAEADADARTPLLRVAEDRGVNAPHGCRMGICHSCDATLVSGCVRDLRTGETTAEPGARIQICVCAAAGDVDLAL